MAPSLLMVGLVIYSLRKFSSSMSSGLGGTRGVSIMCSTARVAFSCGASPKLMGRAFMFRTQGMFGFGKSTAKQLNKETAVGITFKDVAGCDEAKVRAIFCL